MDSEKKTNFLFGFLARFGIGPFPHRDMKDCTAYIKLNLIFTWLNVTFVFTAFAACVLCHTGYYKDSIFGLVLELSFLIMGCLTLLFMSILWLKYVENKTDFILFQGKKDMTLLESKLDEISEKLDRLLSDDSSNRRSFQPQNEVVVLKDIRHLSVKSCGKATHSSETRTPSALDMSPIVPETKFHSLSDNQLETDDQKSFVDDQKSFVDDQKSFVDDHKPLTDDHPCDQRQSADASDDCVDVDPPTMPKSSGVIADDVANLEKSDIVL